MYCLCGISKLGIVIKQEQKQKEKRQCAYCKSFTTRSYDGHEQWYHTHDNKTICARCYVREIAHPHNLPRRITFKGKRVYTNKNPRTGECSHCHRTVVSGDIKLTHIHHDLYDPKNPEANTRELCISCHRKYHTGSLK